MKKLDETTGIEGVGSTGVLERLDGAVWSYIYHNLWVLIASDGELLVEIKGEFPNGVYGYNGKRYASDTQAKAAAMRDLRSNKI